MTKPDVSVLIVSHGHADLIRDCLSTLDQSLVGLSHEIVLVDNLNEPDFLDKVGGARGDMTVMQNETRMGFGANMNKAAGIAMGRFLLILNPDTKYHSGQVADAVRFLESDISHGVVAARLLNDDLTDQRNFRAFPSMWIAVLRGFGADRWTWRPGFYRRSLLEGVELEGPSKVDWVYGSFMIMRRSVFEAFGGFDEGFFMYYEDVDLCLRLRKAGLSTWVYPELVFMHHHFRTSAEAPSGAHRKHHINSLVRYVRKSNGFLTGPRMPRTAAAFAAHDDIIAAAANNALALAVAPTSLRPLVPLAYILTIAGATTLAAMLTWALLGLPGWTRGPVDTPAMLIAVFYIACILIAEFMLQEFNSVRLGDVRGRVIGVVESSILASFPVALFSVAFSQMTARRHDMFVFLLVPLAVALNALATFAFARLVSSEGARVGLVVDGAPDRSIRAPDLPVGLQVVSEIVPMTECNEVKRRLSEAIRADSIDHVLLLTGERRSNDVLHLVRDLSMFDIPIWYAEVGESGASRLVQLRAPLRSRAREGLKRGFDLVFGLIALAALFVPMLIVAAAIKLEDGGPVFFGQPRLGRNQVPFMMLKFRSMHAAQSDVRGDALTKRGDSRITRVGALLRRTSLDELPQLINVINGEMSLVGPRPLPVGFHFKGSAFDQMIPDWHYRYRVRPGITGLSQVKGLRGTPDHLADACRMMQDRVRYDNLYIDHWSIWLDLKIIAMTAVSGAFLSRAY